MIRVMLFYAATGNETAESPGPGAFGDAENVREARQTARAEFTRAFGSEALPCRHRVLNDDKLVLDEEMFGPRQARRLLHGSDTTCFTCGSPERSRRCPSCGELVCNDCWDWSARVCQTCEEICDAD
jgi:hypothetical protein